MPEEHSARFNMVMTPDERAMLQELAASEFRKESDVIRRLVTAAYRDAFGNKKPGKPVPKYNSRTTLAAKAKRAARSKKSR
jgi:hypothetical protein